MGDAELTSAFELLGPSLRVFQRAVQCLTKLGKDAAVILRGDELVLHGADDAHSAAMQFAFRRRCFRSTPATRAAATSAAAPTAEASVVVVARSLLGALRGAQQRMAESLTLGLSSEGEQPKLVLQFTARFGAMVRHRVPLLESSAFLPGEPTAGPHVAALSPSLLSRVLDHCSPPAKAKSATACEEVTIVAEPREGIRVRSYDLLSGGRPGIPDAPQETRSEVLIQRSDLEACHLDPRGGEVTLSGRGLRDFAKATDGYMRELDSMGLLEGSPLLELRFGADGATVICRLATAAEGHVRCPQDFSAVLIIATRELPGDEEVAETLPAVLETQPAPATQGVPASGRRPQKQGSKRRAISTLPAASAFDAFPDHGASAASQSVMISPSPAPATAPRPAAAPSTAAAVAPPLQIRRASAAPQEHFPVAHAKAPSAQQSRPPAAPTYSATAAAVAARPAPMVESVPVFQGFAESQGSEVPATVPATEPAWSAPPPAHVTGISEVPRPLVVGQQYVTSTPPPSAPVPEGRQWLWQGGQALPNLRPHQHAGIAYPGGPQPTLASQLSARALHVPEDSDDEEVGADPDEVAFARGDPGVAEESVDWFDVDKLW